jgi:hypothetical protein
VAARNGVCANTGCIDNTKKLKRQTSNFISFFKMKFIFIGPAECGTN